MTRINLVPVEDLCDQHLLSEHRELTRIPNTIASGKAKLDGNYPRNYTLGKGHVRFFYPRLQWLHNRYAQLHSECLNRRFNVLYKWPDSLPERLYRDWKPTQQDILLNESRIRERMPLKARYKGALL